VHTTSIVGSPSKHQPSEAMTTPVLDLLTATHMAAVSFSAYMQPTNDGGEAYRDRYADDTRVWYQGSDFVKEHFAHLLEVELKALSGARWPRVRPRPRDIVCQPR
jgi:hypothetical protein